MLKYTSAFIGITLFLLGFASCKKSNPEPIPVPETSFESYLDRGILENNNISEASGIIASRSNPGNLWIINDSREYGPNENRVYLIDAQGKGKTNLFLNNIRNRDWEALSIFTESDGSHTLFIGDIGDTEAGLWPNYFIYWFKEPTASPNSNQEISISNINSLAFTLSDGQARNMESMFLDQKTKDLFLITKLEDKKRLYYIPASELRNGNQTKAQFLMELEVSIPFSANANVKTAFNITDACISPDNTEILIRNYVEIYYWKRKTGESIADALKRQAKTVPARSQYNAADGQGESQGEGICFSQDQGGYYTISEGLPTHLYFFKRK